MIIDRLRIGNRGAATVEMAIVAPLLIFLLFAIVEFGLIVRDVIQVHEAAREGARVAVVGATTTTIESRATSALSPLDPTKATVIFEYRRWDFSTGSWGSWTPLQDAGPVNEALAGDQIRVRVRYPHQLIVTGLFGAWADGGAGGIKTVQAATVMRRE